MIKTNDLRFTNWVIFNGEYKQAKYVFFSDGNPFKNDELKVEPIPLTPEILEKCGDVVKVSDEEYRLGNLVFQFALYEDGYVMNVFLHGTLINFIEHVHSFQNLYHALSGGEELIINL